MPSPLTARDLDRLRRLVRRMDERIDEAKKLLARGAPASRVREKLAPIGGLKTGILRLLPDVVADAEGRSRIRYENLYLILRHFLHEAGLAEMLIETSGGNAEWWLPKPDCRVLVRDLGDTISQLEQWLGGLDWVLEEEADKLDEVVELARHVRTMLRNFCATGQKPSARDRNRFNEVDDRVREFLAQLFDEFDYWQTFWFLYRLDLAVELATSLLRRRPLAAADRRHAGEQLAEAERVKHALERLVRRLEPKPIPFEPGMEDLIPFPPPDHA